MPRTKQNVEFKLIAFRSLKPDKQTDRLMHQDMFVRNNNNSTGTSRNKFYMKSEEEVLEGLLYPNNSSEDIKKVQNRKSLWWSNAFEEVLSFQNKTKGKGWYFFLGGYKYDENNNKIIVESKKKTTCSIYNVGKTSVNINCIVGKNGCGKSTIINSIMLLMNNILYPYYSSRYIVWNNERSYLYFIENLFCEVAYEYEEKIHIMSCRGRCLYIDEKVIDINFKVADDLCDVKHPEFNQFGGYRLQISIPNKKMIEYGGIKYSNYFLFQNKSIVPPIFNLFYNYSNYSFDLHTYKWNWDNNELFKTDSPLVKSKNVSFISEMSKSASLNSLLSINDTDYRFPIKVSPKRIYSDFFENNDYSSHSTLINPYFEDVLLQKKLLKLCLFKEYNSDKKRYEFPLRNINGRTQIYQTIFNIPNPDVIDNSNWSNNLNCRDLIVHSYTETYGLSETNSIASKWTNYLVINIAEYFVGVCKYQQISNDSKCSISDYYANNNKTIIDYLKGNIEELIHWDYYNIELNLETEFNDFVFEASSLNGVKPIDDLIIERTHKDILFLCAIMSFYILNIHYKNNYLDVFSSFSDFFIERRDYCFNYISQNTNWICAFLINNTKWKDNAIVYPNSKYSEDTLFRIVNNNEFDSNRWDFYDLIMNEISTNDVLGDSINRWVEYVRNMYIKNAIEIFVERKRKMLPYDFFLENLDECNLFISNNIGDLDYRNNLYKVHQILVYLKMSDFVKFEDDKLIYLNQMIEVKKENDNNVLYYYKQKFLLGPNDELIPNENFSLNGVKVFLEDLLFEELFEHQLYIQEDNALNLRPISEISSGEKQLLYIRTNLLFDLMNIESGRNRATYKSLFEKRNSLIQTSPELNDITYKYINVMFDEVELYLHPEWQRQFVSNLIDGIKRLNLQKIEGINITIATHSPFVLSDVPKSNVLFLETDGSQKACDEIDTNTFGANIHDMLSSNFFMSSTIGEYAQNEVKKIVEVYNKWKKNKKCREVKQNEARFRYIQSILGDGYYKDTIMFMIDKMYNGNRNEVVEKLKNATPEQYNEILDILNRNNKED